MTDTDTAITDAEICHTIVRTAYSRVRDCLIVLKEQNPNLEEMKLEDTVKERLTAMLWQDFMFAENPSQGSAPLRHAKPEDQERDFEVAAYFKNIVGGYPKQQALAKSAMMHIVDNFKDDPMSGGMHFK